MIYILFYLVINSGLIYFFPSKKIRYFHVFFNAFHDCYVFVSFVNFLLILINIDCCF